jgi:ankyrin repeat protein
LILAVYGDHLDFAAWLIDQGAGMEVADDHGRTPLLLVARETGSVPMARLLIDRGADVNARDRHGDTPLRLAAWRGFEPLVDLLLDSGAVVGDAAAEVNGLIGLACSKRLSRLFALLMEHEPDLTVTTDTGGNLLHAAASGGSVEIVQGLLTRGLPMEEADRYGWTPLHYAASKGREEAIALLLDEGAAIDARTLSGRSAYNVAASRGHDPAAELLASRGADQRPRAFPELRGPYMGQRPPGREPAVFALDIVSQNEGQHGCVTFSPDGTEAYWSSFLRVQDTGYSSPRVYASTMRDGRWTTPAPAFFTGEGGTAADVPMVAPGGQRIYFSSRRALEPSGPRGKENIWFAEKTESGWSEPRPVDEAVNRRQMHWQASVSADGSLYLMIEPGGIACAPMHDGRHGEPVPISNADGDDFGGGSPFIAADGSYLLFSSRREGESGGVDLYITFRDDRGQWTKPVNLGPTINSSATDNCPIVSHDGKYLFFLSNRLGKSDVYWVQATIIDELRGKVLK